MDEKDEITVWRLQTNTKGMHHAMDVARYCLEHHVAAIGWSMADHQLQHLDASTKANVQAQRSNITTFQDYRKAAEMCGWIKAIEKVAKLVDLPSNSLLWMRSKGQYYLGLVQKDSAYHYDNSQTAQQLDAANQITNIHWQLVGGEGDVPGKVTTAFIRGQYLQRIHDEGVHTFSINWYRMAQIRAGHTPIREKKALAKTKESFYSLLSASDTEDLLCLWLYKEKGYICIPSTNKTATPLYECVLLDPQTGTSIYPQVKNGRIDLDAQDYQHLDGEVWLFTTQGRILHAEAYANVHCADPQVLFDFVKDAGKKEAIRNILSPCLRTWASYFETSVIET